MSFIFDPLHMILSSPQRKVGLFLTIVTGLITIFVNRKVFLLATIETSMLLWGAFSWAIFCVGVGHEFKYWGYSYFSFFPVAFLITLFYSYLFFLKKDLKWTIKQFVSFISTVILIPTVIVPFVVVAILRPVATYLLSQETMPHPLAMPFCLLMAIFMGHVSTLWHSKIVHMANINTRELLWGAFYWGTVCGSIHIVLGGLGIFFAFPLIVAFYLYSFFLKKNLKWRVTQLIFFVLSIIPFSIVFTISLGSIIFGPYFKYWGLVGS